jgi:5-methyltetrahydrofolate--homocysteine methyltransferase
VVAAIDDAKALFRAEGFGAEGVWRFFRATSQGHRLTLLDAQTGAEAAHFDLPRQARPDGLCIADYVLPPSTGADGGHDHVALFVTTAGRGIRDRADELKAAGEYVRCHALAALAIESAEAAAELLHHRIRAAWGLADPADLTRQECFQARYRGKRYSFGYPACPDLEMQQQLFEVLRPEEIGVTLTEGDMMEPEASVSALVIHHPDARYFGV